MPIRQLDRAAIRREARELIRTARVSPIKFTLLFLAVSLALSLLDTALTSLTGRIVGVAFVSVSFASILIGLITQVLDAGYKCYCLDHCFIFQGQFFHFCPIHWNGEVEDNLPDPVAIRLPFREQLDSLDKCPHKFFSLHLGGGFIDLIERQQ